MTDINYAIIQIISGIFLSIFVLLQTKGSGLGSTFGGESGMYRSKRGAEKMLFRLTIIMSLIFITASVLNLIFGA